MENNTFGSNIQKFRKEKEWTQANFATELSKHLPSSKNTYEKSVSCWENGQSYPDIPVIIAVSRMMGLSVDALLKDEIKKFGMVTYEELVGQRAENQFADLSDDELYLLYYIIEDTLEHGFDIDTNHFGEFLLNAMVNPLEHADLEKEYLDKRNLDNAFFSLIDVECEKKEDAVKLSIKYDKKQPSEFFDVKQYGWIREIEIPVFYGRADICEELNQGVKYWFEQELLCECKKRGFVVSAEVSHFTDLEREEVLVVVVYNFDEEQIHELYMEYAKREGRKKTRPIIEGQAILQKMLDNIRTFHNEKLSGDERKEAAKSLSEHMQKLSIEDGRRTLAICRWSSEVMKKIDEIEKKDEERT